MARAIRQVLPDEAIVYFGDTAHLPYGDKSKDLIVRYATRITDFLLHERRCKAVVIACNSASAAAYEHLRDAYKDKVPVINVIDPMIEAVIADERIGKAGIIGTKTTIGSGVYQEKFGRRKPSLQLAPLATPLLASMIEEGFYENKISHTVLDAYLSDPILEGIDGLILACTHYPLIKKEIAGYFDRPVIILDSAEVAAAKLKDILAREHLAGPGGGKDHFYVSDYTTSFEKATRLFFGNRVRLEKVRL